MPIGKSRFRLQGTVRLSADGLAKVLGDLEARLMAVVWAGGQPLSARQVHEVVVRRHDVRLITVITVLNRLVAKRLLDRAKHAGNYHYVARLTEDDFREEVSRWVVEGVLPLGPDAVAASLVDVLAEHDTKELARLGRLVRRRLAERGGAGG